VSGAVTGGKRLGVQHHDGDWFTSYSPRASNAYAEGQWDQWVDLAIKILRDPLTAITRPEAHELAQQLEPKNFYDECGRELAEAEIEARFTRKLAT